MKYTFFFFAPLISISQMNKPHKHNCNLLGKSHWINIQINGYICTYNVWGDISQTNIWYLGASDNAGLTPLNIAIFREWDLRAPWGLHFQTTWDPASWFLLKGLPANMPPALPFLSGGSFEINSEQYNRYNFESSTHSLLSCMSQNCLPHLAPIMQCLIQLVNSYSYWK